MPKPSLWKNCTDSIKVRFEIAYLHLNITPFLVYSIHPSTESSALSTHLRLKRISIHFCTDLTPTPNTHQAEWSDVYFLTALTSLGLVHHTPSVGSVWLLGAFEVRFWMFIATPYGTVTTDLWWIQKDCRDQLRKKKKRKKKKKERKKKKARRKAKVG